MKTIKKLTLLTGLSLLTLNAQADFKKQKLYLQECPAAVQKTITDQSSGGLIDEVKKVTFPGSTLYLVEIDRHKARDLDVVISASGEVLARNVDHDD